MPRVYITLVTLFCGLACACSAQALNPSNTDAWLSLEIQRSQIESDWLERKILLDQQLYLHKTKQEELQSKIEISQTTQTDAQERRSDINEKMSEYQDSQSELMTSVEQYTFKVNGLSERLPPPLLETIDGKLEVMNDTSASVTDRLSALIDNVKNINNFSESYHKTEGPILIGPDSSLHVTQIYMGISFAWYLSPDSSEYGVGMPTADGWQWISADNTKQDLGFSISTKEIQTLSDALNGPDGSQFVSIPIAIRKK
ncbi:DUF3450 family protein [Gilvimarinus sp. SDUM040013]|uniref:DUF3450 family protein n=1 Tax=Gilvimarinus gilvus TaxID=3058038 RepID=A0ABU4RUG7_9GAMM|nr:DUF3450 family protein [Gilvimarinus sp. SDUM040013]MDO3388608.1 DUF3450 family protein [Gilvimarinus sp. SDUM040013]MDX6848520.1 DUF3450 family protein [Gilvimarinus sp. SDUM040013]